jgi:hypothetical protein
MTSLKNLEANLKNHIGGTKHEKALEDVKNAKTTCPIIDHLSSCDVVLGMPHFAR